MQLKKIADNDPVTPDINMKFNQHSNVKLIQWILLLTKYMFKNDIRDIDAAAQYFHFRSENTGISLDDLINQLEPLKNTYSMQEIGIYTDIIKISKARSKYQSSINPVSRTIDMTNDDVVNELNYNIIHSSQYITYFESNNLSPSTSPSYM